MPQLLRTRRPASHSRFMGTNRSAATLLAHEPLPPLEYTSSTYLPTAVRQPVNSKTLNPRAIHANYLLAKLTGGEHHHDYDQHAGAEPGVNPRSGASIAEYSHFKQDCVIDVVDYDCDDVTIQRYDNAGLINLLKRKGEPDSSDDDVSLPPRMVRWINIGGIDWDILRDVALKYNLHSLALEDILHERGHTHSKADYYPGHLFIRVLCHTLDMGDHHHYSHNHPPLTQTPAPKDTKAHVPGHDSNTQEESSHSVELPREQPTPDLEGGTCAQGMQRITSEDSESMPKPPPPTDTHGLKGEDADHPSGLMTRLSHLSLKKRMTGLSGFGGPARERKNKEIEALKKSESRVIVENQPMFIILLTDGTVISLHPSPNLDYTTPITERLLRSDSVLRTSEDASLLVESLLDLVVDRVLEVVDEYQTKISQLEHDILLSPLTGSVRSLHILSGDLILLKRTLGPIHTMISGLRRYDLERCCAVADNIAAENHYLQSDSESTVGGGDDVSSRSSGKLNPAGSQHQQHQTPTAYDAKAKARRRRQRKRALLKAGRSHPMPGVSPGMPPQGDLQHLDQIWDQGAMGASAGAGIPRVYEEPVMMQNRRVEGYFSYTAKVYLADVTDHMDFALSSLDMFSGITENLIDYAFNMASYDMNIVMNRLTLVTIIFLPLTLMTGYFGMNFTPFWSVDKHSDRFFWEIAIPVMALLIPMFMFDNIRKAFQYLKRRSDSHKASNSEKIEL